MSPWTGTTPGRHDPASMTQPLDVKLVATTEATSGGETRQDRVKATTLIGPPGTFWSYGVMNRGFPTIREKASRPFFPSASHGKRRSQWLGRLADTANRSVASLFFSRNSDGIPHLLRQNLNHTPAPFRGMGIFGYPAAIASGAKVKGFDRAVAV